MRRCTHALLSPHLLLRGNTQVGSGEQVSPGHLKAQRTCTHLPIHASRYVLAGQSQLGTRSRRLGCRGFFALCVRRTASTQARIQTCGSRSSRLCLQPQCAPPRQICQPVSEFASLVATLEELTSVRDAASPAEQIKAIAATEREALLLTSGEVRAGCRACQCHNSLRTI